MCINLTLIMKLYLMLAAVTVTVALQIHSTFNLSEVCIPNRSPLLPGIKPCDGQLVTPFDVDVCESGDQIFYGNTKIYHKLIEGRTDAINICFSNGKPSQFCSTLCHQNNASSQCTFCDNDCQSASTLCYCKLVYYTDVYEISLKDKVMTFNTCEYKVIGKYAYEHSVQAIFNYPVLKPVKRSRVVNDGSTIVSLNKDVVQIYTTETSGKIVRYRKDDWSWADSFYNLTYNFNLPLDVFTTNGQLEVMVLVDNRIVSLETFTIVSKFKCMVRDCVFCEEVWENWSCVPNKLRFYFVISLIYFIVSLTIGIPTALWLLTFLFTTLTACIIRCVKPKGSKKKLRLIKRVQKAVSKPWLAMRNEFTYEDEDSEEELPTIAPAIEGSESTITLGQMRRLMAQKSKTDTTSIELYSHSGLVSLVFLLTLSIVFPQALAKNCSSGFIIPTSVSKCYRNGDIQNCVNEFSSQVTLPNVHTDYCYVMQDLSTGNLIKNVDIEYEQDMHCTGLDSAYFWSSWRGAVKDYDICWEDDDCTDILCEDINSETGGVISLSGDQNWPGVTSCSRYKPGFFDCVISSVDACDYNRITIIPDGDIWQIFLFGQSRRMPLMGITVTDQDGKEHFSSGYNLNSPISVDVFNLIITGNLADLPPNFSNMKVVYNTRTKEAYVCPAADPSLPVAGGIGDIQAPTLESFQKQGTNQFMRAAGLWTSASSNGKTTTNFVQPGHVGSQCHKLPYTVNGDAWYMSGTELCAYRNNPGAVIAQLVSKGQFNVTEVVNVVCPTALLVNVSGCYDCARGFKAEVQARSTCAQGLVILTVNDDTDINLSTKSLSLTNEMQGFLIYGYTPKKENDFTVTFRSGDSSYDLKIVFTASVDIVITPNNTQNGGNNTSIHKSTSLFKFIDNFFSDIFKGIASWWHYLILLAVAAVVVLIVIFLGPELFTMVKTIISVILRISVFLVSKIKNLLTKIVNRNVVDKKNE